MSKPDASVKIYTFNKDQETLIPLIEETFNLKNISFEIRSKYDTAYDGIFIGQKGLADLYVLRKDEEQSKEILTDLLRDYSSPR